MTELTEQEAKQVASAMRPQRRPLMIALAANLVLSGALLGVPYVRGRILARETREHYVAFVQCMIGGEPAANPGLSLPRGEREHYAAKVLFANADWPMACRPALQRLRPPDATFLWPSLKSAGLDLRAAVDLVDKELVTLAKRRAEATGRVPQKPLDALRRLQAASVLFARAGGAKNDIDNDSIVLSDKVMGLAAPARLPLMIGETHGMLGWSDSGVLELLTFDSHSLAYLRVDGGKVDRQRVRRNSFLRGVSRAGSTAYLAWAMPEAKCNEREDHCALRPTGLARYDKGGSELEEPTWKLPGHPAERLDRSLFISETGRVDFLRRSSARGGIEWIRTHLPLLAAGTPAQNQKPTRLDVEAVATIVDLPDEPHAKGGTAHAGSARSGTTAVAAASGANRAGRSSAGASNTALNNANGAMASTAASNANGANTGASNANGATASTSASNANGANTGASNANGATASTGASNANRATASTGASNANGATANTGASNANRATASTGASNANGANANTGASNANGANANTGASNANGANANTGASNANANANANASASASASNSGANANANANGAAASNANGAAASNANGAAASNANGAAASNANGAAASSANGAAASNTNGAAASNANGVGSSPAGASNTNISGASATASNAAAGNTNGAGTNGGAEAKPQPVAMVPSSATLVHGEPMSVLRATQTAAGVEASLTLTSQPARTLSFETVPGEKPWTAACAAGADRFVAYGSSTELRVQHYAEGPNAQPLSAQHIELGAPLDPEDSGGDRLRFLCDEGRAQLLFVSKDLSLQELSCDSKRCSEARVLTKNVAEFDAVLRRGLTMIAYQQGPVAPTIKLLRLDQQGNLTGTPTVVGTCWDPLGGLCGRPILISDSQRTTLLTRDGPDLLALETTNDGRTFATLSGIPVSRPLESNSLTPMQQHRKRKGMED